MLLILLIVLHPAIKLTFVSQLYMDKETSYHTVKLKKDVIDLVSGVRIGLSIIYK